jgi:hypothetical protein
MKRVFSFTDAVRFQLGAALILVPLLSAPCAADAAADKKLPVLEPIEARYDIYLGGVHLARAQITYQSRPQFYVMDVAAQTHGMWYKLFPWNVSIKSEGVLGDTKLKPAKYVNTTAWKHQPKTTTLDYAPDGKVKVSFVNDSNDEKRDQVPPEMLRSTLDPVSSVLQLMGNLAMDNSCNATAPVFDGKRRFDVKTTDKGEATLSLPKYNVYSGDVRNCEVQFEMIAGKWRDRERSKFWLNSKGEADRPPFTVSLAHVSPQAPYIPVRVEGKSGYGLIVVHLTGWKYGNELKREAKLR